MNIIFVRACLVKVCVGLTHFQTKQKIITLTSGDTIYHHLPYIVNDLLLSPPLCLNFPSIVYTCVYGKGLYESDRVCSMSVRDYSLQDIQGVLFYVPLLYSCSAMLGVLMTSVCTPVGFSHLFPVLGKIIVQPKVSH